MLTLNECDLPTTLGRGCAGRVIRLVCASQGCVIPLCHPIHLPSIYSDSVPAQGTAMHPLGDQKRMDSLVRTVPYYPQQVYHKDRESTRRGGLGLLSTTVWNSWSSVGNRARGCQRRMGLPGRTVCVRFLAGTAANHKWRVTWSYLVTTKQRETTSPRFAASSGE